MACLTYLSDAQVKAYSKVDVPEMDELLQELRKVTGENWLVSHDVIHERNFLGRKTTHIYTLYADCHGEWQIINFAPGKGNNSNFGQCANFMLGYISATVSKK